MGHRVLLAVKGDRSRGILGSRSLQDQAVFRIEPDYIDLGSFAYAKAWPGGDLSFSSVISEPTKLDSLFLEIIDLLDAKAWVAEDAPESGESWVHVQLSGSLLDTLQGFGETAAVLTWPNSD